MIQAELRQERGYIEVIVFDREGFRLGRKQLFVDSVPESTINESIGRYIRMFIDDTEERTQD